METCEKCGADPVEQRDWKCMRNLVEHEDVLVNNRLAWMLAFNGFLFTALGLSFSAEATALVKLGENAPETFKTFGRSVEILRASLATAGVLSSLAAIVGVVAALAAIRCAATTFEDSLQGKSSGHPKFFPASSKNARSLGMFSATLFPIIIAGVWTGYLTWLLRGSATDARTYAALVIFGLLMVAKIAMSSLEASATRERGISDTAPDVVESDANV